ncbi:MAG: primosomal protein N' [Clostridia bacterium]|nr:primosomal protein N' [Clostridia bacterium]
MRDIAGVHILESPYHLDKVYHYYIPAELSERVVPGAIVEVPFGNGNRRVTAVVCELSDQTDIDELKPVLSASPVIPPYLSEEGLKLCNFLKQHTLCTFGEAVRCVLPSAAISKMAEYYSVTSELSDSEVMKALDGLNEKCAFVYAAVSSVKRMSRETLRTRFGEDVIQVLAKLIKAGLIQKHDEMKAGGSNVKTVTTAFPSDLAEDAPPMRSLRQSQVLEVVKTSPGITLSDICSSLSLEPVVVRSTLSALEKKALISLKHETVYRNPFSQSEGEIASYRGNFTLSEDQTSAFNTLLELYSDPAPRAALLHGVTGSGKTNVILKLISRVLEDGRGVIMLVPEIALTPQTVGRFIACFGDRIAVIHSALSAGERFDAWRRIREGIADVVIGTRSAVFAPVKNLGLIVIDEEHEHTYKSDTNPKYLAHDVASFRCGETGATLVLASATPSVTSYHKAVTGKYTLVELKNRFGGASLPTVELCDMRTELRSGNSTPLSRTLISRIGSELERGNQTILFLNRRGYNSVISCRSCGEAVKCPHCSVTMTYHLKNGRQLPRDSETGEAYLDVRRGNGYLHCHMCGYKSQLPSSCPDCGDSHFMFMGCGTQLAENELKRLFPTARIARMDHDTTQGKLAYEELLTSFRNGSADILLGTQMVTKGHDFPKVTTVGVLNADSSLFLDDYRANERTFSMLTQVIGRAGRSELGGMSVIQSFNVDSDIINLASKQNYRSFYENEIRLRRQLTFPPFCDIAMITIACSDEAMLSQAALRMGERIREHIREEFTDVKAIIYGPFEAPVYKVQNVCRLRFVIKCRLNRRTREFISSLLCDFSRSGKASAKGMSQVRVTADLNPTTI